MLVRAKELAAREGDHTPEVEDDFDADGDHDDDDDDLDDDDDDGDHLILC